MSVGASATGGVGHEVAALTRLAWPLAATNLGNVAIGTVHTVVVGRLDATDIGAVSLGTSIYFAVIVLGVGCMLGLDPLVSQAVGAREPKRARAMARHGVVAALGVGVVMAVVAFWLAQLLPYAGIDPVTSASAAAYVNGRLPGLPLFLAFVAARTYLQASGVTRPLLVGVIVANVVNLPLSYALVLGDHGLREIGLPAIGAPVLGVLGAGISASISNLVQLGVVLVAMRMVPADDAGPPPDPARTTIARMLRLGLPVGLQLLAEVGAFASVAVLAGGLGPTPLAGHQVAITIASTTFQVPLAIGAAASARVGRAIGASDAAGARRAGLVAIGVGAVFMLCSSIVLLAFPHGLATLVSPRAHVVEAAVPLLVIACLFQLSDGVQAVASGALRGAGDTRFPLAMNMVGYYLAGLPLGVVLGLVLDWGVAGLWWGLSAGLTIVSVANTLRFMRVSARPIERA